MSDRLLVAEYEGRIWSFLPNDPTGKKDLFLDMGRGISAFSFHPKYKENGYVFVFSHADMKLPSETKQKSRVSQISIGGQAVIRRAFARIARRSSSSGLQVDTMAEKRSSGRTATSTSQREMEPAVPMSTNPGRISRTSTP